MSAKSTRPCREIYERLVVQPWSPSYGVPDFPQRRVLLLQGILERGVVGEGTRLGTLRRASYLNQLGVAHYRGGEPVRAEERFRESVELSREIGERSNEIDALGNWGVVRRDLGDTATAERLLTEALVLSRAGHNVRLERRLLVELFVNAYQDSRFRRARLWLAESSRFADGEVRAASGHQLNAALIAAQEGRQEEAWTLGNRALRGFREFGDPSGEGLTLLALGFFQARRGDLAGALHTTEQAKTIFSETGDRRWEGLALANLAVLHEALGQSARTE